MRDNDSYQPTADYLPAPINPQVADYEVLYQEESFWAKVRRFSRKSSRAGLENALKLYYAAKDPATPGWARKVMYSALGYWILPVDAIPDLLPAAGYTDDIGVMTLALATVALHITDAHQRKARETLKRWWK